MKISVSMPVYNAECHLDQSISSIINQTFSDYELVLVDDGSKDNSLSVCKKWKEKYPERIRIIEKENSGSLLTRKRCIEESKYDYVYIMDSDDKLIDPNALQILSGILDETKADIVFFDSKTDDKQIRTFGFKDGTVFENDKLIALYDTFLQSTDLYPLWNKVFNKELIDFENDYDDYSDIIYGTDLYQTIPIICRAKKVVYVKRSLYNYTFEGNGNSIVHKFKPQSYITAKKNQIRLERYAREYMSGVEELENKLSRNRMIRISTAIYKARLISNNDGIRKYDYLKSISEDKYFRENYSYCRVGFRRRLILSLTYFRLYKLLAILLK